MILILSQEEEISTDKVIAWLLKWNKKFIRINRENQSLELDVQLMNHAESVNIKKCDEEFVLNDISAFWYRRGNFNWSKSPITLPDEYKALNDQLKKVVRDENRILSNYLHLMLKDKPSISSYPTASINKLKALQKAKAAGLLIPETMISTERKVLIDFLDEHQKVIVKPIFEVFLHVEKEYTILCYTKIFEKENIKKLPERFLPSLFQRYISKRYELRIFYLQGECYGMAIFSQESEQTSIDFRQYNYEDPNRTIPFKLPQLLKNRITTFMDSVNLNCGSIDMIVSEDYQFYFLEVNPIGQYGMTSHPCNYYLNKKIAKILSNARS